MNYRFCAVALLLVAAVTQSSCERAKPNTPKEGIGHVTTHLRVTVGSIWGGGYLVDVAPGEYALVEHRTCPNAKEPEFPVDRADGYCVARITTEQSNRFEAAMERFKRNSRPLESFSFEDPNLRPDGKPCKSEVTDHTTVSLIWTGTEGKIATFYLGCDYEEFESFYKSVLSVTDPLPIQEFIKER